MDPGSRRAWTEVVTPQDYDQHMVSVGQAQAAARLTRALIDAAKVPAGGRVDIVGAGTGQLLDFMDADVLRPFRLTFTDLSPSFLDVLRGRLAKHEIDAVVVEDDVEHTQLAPEPDLILACLLLEHIDWRLGVNALTGLRPAACGFILQENPPGMTGALTPGRSVPPSVAKAMTIAHAELVPSGLLIRSMSRLGYRSEFRESASVADEKRLVALAFRRSGPVG